jgi:MATE family multidrug resistance protein
MVLSVSGHWLMTGVVFVLTRLLRVEPRHAWLSVVGFVLLLAGLFLMRYRSGKWRSLRVVEPDGAEPPPSRPHDEMEIKL